MRVCVCNCGSRSPSRVFPLSPWTFCQVARHPPPSGDTISTGLHHLPPREGKAARQNLTDPPSLPCATESSKIQRTSTIPEDLPRGKLPVFPSRLFASTISLGVSSNGGVTKGRPFCSIKEELHELDFDSSTKTSGSFVASRPIHRHRTNSSTSGLSRILRMNGTIAGNNETLRGGNFSPSGIILERLRKSDTLH